MRTLVPVVLLAACTGKTPTETDPSTPIPTIVPTDTDGDTDPLVPTADTGPDLPVFDCAALLGPPFVTENVPAARGRHGLAFDTLGNLVGENGTSLILASDPNTAGVLTPNLGQLEQMDYLPSGELVIARLNNGSITGVMPDGQTRIIAQNVNAYGVIVGPDGFIYTANQDRVHRIDPTDGTRTVFVDLPNGASPKVVNFSPAHDRFYIGTNYGNGQVFQVALDANLEPTGPVTVLAPSVGDSWHDGLGVDVCGNLYVNEFWSRGLYRVNPATGAVTTLVTFSNDQYGHGMRWGSGVGSWPADSVFIPQPYNGNTVRRADIGIPERTFNGGNYIVVGL